MEVKIEKLVYGGEGLGRGPESAAGARDGATVFVPYVLPGEVVEVEVRERKKKFARGRLVRVVQASEARVKAACPHFGICGGCHYQQIGYEKQVAWKAEILRETLGRLGRVKWEGEIHTRAAEPWGYRNRAQWKVRPSAAGAGGLDIGYFARGTTALCAVTKCDVLTPKLRETLEKLRVLLRDGGMPGTLREVEAFADGRDEKILLTAAFSEFGAEKTVLAEKLRAATGAASVLLHETARDRFELAGPGYLEYEAGGAKLRVGHLSFFQVNRFMVEEMVKVVEAEAGGGLAMDLYAGVGLFSLPLVKKFARVIAVEANPAAARDLSLNLEAAGIAKEKVQAVEQEAGEFLKRCGEKADLVVVDPPRAGVEEAALGRLMELGPERILYFSCDAATLARDLGKLAGEGGGYEVAGMEMLDVFPQTFHVEAVVRMRRK